MRSVKIAITIEEGLPTQLDQLVAENKFPSRSRAVQEAIRDKLLRMKRSRLASECAKLDADEERGLAEEGLTGDADSWPEYGEAMSCGRT